MRLLRDDVEDIEINNGDRNNPPSFVGQSEALQYQMTRVEGKVKQLHQLHERHLARPTLDDFSKDETEIKALTSEISQVWSIFGIFGSALQFIVFYYT